MLEQVIQEHPGGLPLVEAYRSDRHWVCCRTCRKRHEFYPDSDAHRAQQCEDFRFRHPESRGCYVFLLTPDRIAALARRTERRRALLADARHYAHNASILTAFQGSDQSLDLTSLNSLASSATAGWSSPYIDNSSALYLDILAALTLAAVNTAPGSDKAFYIYGGTSLNTTDRPATGAASGGVCANSGGTAAALTFPSVSTLASVLPGVWTVPYSVQNAPTQSPLFSVARVFGNYLGLYVWLPILNFSGMTIAAASNAFKYRGVYNTVA